MQPWTVDLGRGVTVEGERWTCVWLLALAVRHGGCLATFDRSIPLSVVRGATKAHLQVLGAT